MSKIIRHGITMSLKQALIAVFVFLSIHAHASDISEGEWVGGSDLFQSPAYMHLNFSTSDKPKGFIDIPQWKVVKRSVLNLTINGNQIYFEIPSNTGIPFIAEGRFANGSIEGVISRGDKKGKFHLIFIKKIPSVILEKYVGCYRVPDQNNNGAFLPVLITYSAN